MMERVRRADSMADQLQTRGPPFDERLAPPGASSFEEISDADDGDIEAFGTNRADRRIGSDDIAVAHGGSDCSGETLNVVLVSGLGADDGESVHRLYA